MNINQYLVDQLADYQVDSRDYTSHQIMLMSYFTAVLQDQVTGKRLRNLQKKMILTLFQEY